MIPSVNVKQHDVAGAGTGAAVRETLASLRRLPFKLDDASIDWVRDTFDVMSVDERLRQLFALVLIGDSLDDADAVASFAPGAVVRAPGSDRFVAWQATQRVASGARVPMLVAADLEGGANHPACLPQAPNALMLAAVDDPTLTAAVTGQIARDARRQGFNWAFGPVLDISARFRSAIVGTRSFGSDPERIACHAAAQVHALQTEGLAATLKHWPGDGHDDRDQHLCTSVNPLHIERWRQSHGAIYRRLIDAGALTVMAGHIALPAWATASGSDPDGEAYLPASARSALLQGLLRDEFGFNGLIVSDALPMGGFSSAVGEGDRAVVALQAGCDMLLFSPDPDGDLGRLHSALAENRLAPSRVDAAVLRVLGLKAALGLHKAANESRTGELPVESVAEADARTTLFDGAAGAAVTLIKDRRNVLPLSPHRHRRLLLLDQQPKSLWPGQPGVNLEPLIETLVDQGFQPRRLQPGEALPAAWGEADAVLYVLLQESYLTVGHIGIDWNHLHGGFAHAMARPWHDKPVLMVSFGHPYHLYDAPAMPCYLNAYAATADAQRAVARCLVGGAPFTGRSPVDAFCELDQTKG